MRIYEELFIVRPDLPEEEIDVIVEQARTTVTNSGGTVDKVEKWGVRKLAYRVDKRNEGYYAGAVPASDVLLISPVQAMAAYGDQGTEKAQAAFRGKVGWPQPDCVHDPGQSPCRFARTRSS